MIKSLLTASLKLAPSTLYVADLAGMTKFYNIHAGLEILERSDSSVLLGNGQVAAIRLVSKPKLAHAGPREAGLFHNAIVFDSRGQLARTVGTLVTNTPKLFSGTGDHLVSEAFYFNDPEGNGVELYFDRPADTWQWINGYVAMDTLYIDPLKYIQSYASEAGASDKKLGHVHLRIGNIADARYFYIDLLGFDVTADLGSALFVSIGGYHHHIGLNTWQSAGAGMRSETLGLSNVTIMLQNDNDLSMLTRRLEQADYSFSYRSGVVYVTDPWGNKFIFHDGGTSSPLSYTV